jgi:FdhD protein
MSAAEEPQPIPGMAPQGAVRRELEGSRPDLLVQEEPLLIEVQGNPLLTMRTPGRDQDLALGFLLGEGVIAAAAEVEAIEFTPGDAEALRADTVRVRLARPPDARTRGRLQRTHEIRSSCGACGLADPAQILEDTPALLPGVPKLQRSALPRLFRLLQERQPLFAATGACHGALLASADGRVLGHGEDVGRHNALDKAIGMAARTGHDFTRAIALLSGRAGYDLVVKCLRVRIPVIASVSAPSALAFDLCRSAGATLIGFVRGDRAQVYCDPGRLQ